LYLLETLEFKYGTVKVPIIPVSFSFFAITLQARKMKASWRVRKDYG
jgi:hypothetical protein